MDDIDGDDQDNGDQGDDCDDENNLASLVASSIGRLPVGFACQRGFFGDSDENFKMVTFGSHNWLFHSVHNSGKTFTLDWCYGIIISNSRSSTTSIGIYFYGNEIVINVVVNTSDMLNRN